VLTIALLSAAPPAIAERSPAQTPERPALCQGSWWFPPSGRIRPRPAMTRSAGRRRIWPTPSTPTYTWLVPKKRPPPWAGSAPPRQPARLQPGWTVQTIFPKQTLRTFGDVW